MNLRKDFLKRSEYIGTKYHVVFWLVYFTFNTLRWGSYYEDLLFSLKGNLVEFPLHIILCYFTIYYLIPKLIFKRRFVLFSLIIIILLFALALVKYELTYWFVSRNVWPEGPQQTTEFTFNYALVMMLGEFYVLSFVTAIKTTADFLRESSRAARLEKARMESELRFLRSQISPHFFFNTLNNIYSLSLERSDKTPEVVLKLSELMRYLVYETKPHKQSLKKEILCIQNYLDLERLRYAELLKVDLNISGDLENKKIAPMLLIPFVENAFKHGANKNVGNVEIKIDFIIDDKFLYFKIRNTSLLNTYAPKLKNAGGIGIANVKKRLELGYSKNEYRLEIHELKNEFIVDLKLKLR
ncbi:MAG: histidine kinase [Leeuwenhoekiella sp.]